MKIREFVKKSIEKYNNDYARVYTRLEGDLLTIGLFSFYKEYMVMDMDFAYKVDRHMWIKYRFVKNWYHGRYEAELVDGHRGHVPTQVLRAIEDSFNKRKRVNIVDKWIGKLQINE